MLEIKHLTKTVGASAVVDDVTLHVPVGKCMALFGPSGSGKTSLLRLIAGLDTADVGVIQIGGRPASTPHVVLSPAQRQIGMVFQDLALWPHMSALDHLRFMMAREGNGSKQSARTLLAAIGLAGLDARKPHELSGGEQQRLALARALAGSPRLLLLDEPFSNLESELRTQLLAHVSEYSNANGVTMVYVTHVPRDLPGFADRVAMMDRGRIHTVESTENFCTRFGLEMPA